MLQTITTDQFIDFLGQSGKGANSKYCFILGSGCSVENGISTGWELAKKWYDELISVYTEQEIKLWKEHEKIDENDLGYFYSRIFKFRFALSPEEGYKAIDFEIEKGRTGFGHIILTQIMLKTNYNVVITTNFDTLIEETMYAFTDVRPIICGHESIAQYARPSGDRPLIIKIHRDRFMDPLNLDDEIAALKPEWLEILNNIFHDYIPIFIGYGGNDGSLMGYLNNISPCKNMLWCTNSKKPLRQDIQETIKYHKGQVVQIESFNRLMLRLMPVYNILSVQKIVRDKAKNLEEKYINSLLTLTKDVQDFGTQKEKEQVSYIVESFDQSDWWHWEMKTQSATTLKEKEEVLIRGLEILPASPELNYSLGCYYLEHDSFAEAVKYLHKVVSLDEYNADAWLCLGVAYRNLSDYDHAIECYRKTVEVKSTYSVAWNNMGICYHSKADYNEAINCYKRSIAIKPDKANTWNNLGFSYKVLGRTAEAIKCYNKAIKLHPGLAKAFFNLGNIYYDKKDYKKAIHYYKKSVRFDPTDADAFYNLGLAFEDIKSLVKAKECFKKAHRLNPNDSEFKKRLDNIYA